MTRTQQQQYLDRIEYQGPLSAQLETLKALQRKHLLAIPFENLDVHLGNRILLDTTRIFDKLILQKRGGFCYELNGIFYELLRSIGFTVKYVSAIVMDENRQWTPEYDHLSLVVSLPEGDYLSDVGFGRFSFWPIKLEKGLVQKDEEGRFLVESGPAERLMISKWTDDEWVGEFAFYNRAEDLQNFAPRCAYQQDDPNSHFLKQRIITRPSSQGRLTLTDKSFKITQAGQTFHEVAIINEADFQHKLRQYFGISL
ncbi:MAG: arylamine N-acetyltransferase [Bacteroidota bacterium]